MTNLSAGTSHNSPATIYTIVDTSTNRDNATGKRMKLIANDGTVLYDSGTIGIGTDTFPVPIDATWITTLAILSVQVFLTYNELGGAVTGPLQDNYVLPTISNTKQ